MMRSTIAVTPDARREDQLEALPDALQADRSPVRPQVSHGLPSIATSGAQAAFRIE
jgi:hypothetical protein